MTEYFIRPTDKPAILGVSTLEVLSSCKSVLHELDYKVHTTSTHEDFVNRFGQVQYQIAIIEDRFACAAIEENLALMRIQYMQMNLRRHAMIMLIGEAFQSMNTLQAFHQSVHVVVHPSDLASLKQIVQQVLADNDLFLNVYRDTQLKMTQGKI